jgi:uncharacterized protein with von Willebrand factor type A (vWA) domain
VTNETQTTIKDLNKKIARTIAFRDRMRDLNKGLKSGMTEKELAMRVFEIETRAREGNHRLVKTKDGRTLKLFSRNLLDRSYARIRRMCDEKNELIQLAHMNMA